VLEVPMIVVPDSDDPDCANILVDGKVAGRRVVLHCETDYTLQCGFSYDSHGS
jgi:hypothetical protein